MGRTLLTAILAGSLALGGLAYGNGKDRDNAFLRQYMSPEQIELAKHPGKFLKQSKQDTSIFSASLNSKKSFLEIACYVNKKDTYVLLGDTRGKTNWFFLPKGAKVEEYDIMIIESYFGKCLDYKTADVLAKAMNKIVRGTFYGFTPSTDRNGIRDESTCFITFYKIKENNNSM